MFIQLSPTKKGSVEWYLFIGNARTKICCRCMNIGMFKHKPYVGSRTSAPMVAEVSLFQVADAPTSMYDYTLPPKKRFFFRFNYFGPRSKCQNCCTKMKFFTIAPKYTKSIKTESAEMMRVPN